MQFLDKPHPWIEIAMGALTQGALADTFKRFPIIAEVFQSLVPGKLAKLTEETKHNEDMAIELTEKYASLPAQPWKFS